MPIEKSRDFRIIYANRFGLRVSDNDFGLSLANDSVIETEQVVTQEVYVAMTPKAVKILTRILSDAVKGFEDQFGEISISEESFTAKKIEDFQPKPS